MACVALCVVDVVYVLYVRCVSLLHVDGNKTFTNGKPDVLYQIWESAYRCQLNACVQPMIWETAHHSNAQDMGKYVSLPMVCTRVSNDMVCTVAAYMLNCLLSSLSVAVGVGYRG